jgi:hypothetical protein
MKTKIVAILDTPFKAKKEGSGMVKLCVQYPEQLGNKSAMHMVYSKSIAALHALKVGDLIDLNLKMDEFCFMAEA